MKFFQIFFNRKRNTENSNIKIPKFIGSEDDFTKFIGPYSRNLVQSITKKYKTKKGCCEHCGKKNGQLDASHIKGKERDEIIKSIINKFNSNESFQVDLNQFKQEFIEEHNPIEKVIIILCKHCHRKYDLNTKDQYKTIKNVEVNKALVQNFYAKKEISAVNTFSKLDRIELWSNRPTQYNHRIIKAFLEVANKADVTPENLELFCHNTYDISKQSFRSNYASMKTDVGNSHGKVFYEEKGYVKVYPKVMNEIKRYFRNL